MTVRPTPDQVLALAGDRRRALAAAAAAEPAVWSAAGCDDGVLWGRYVGTTAEPYEVVVELSEPRFGCSCPSRRRPCKHGLGLLLAHARGSLAVLSRPALVDSWLERHTGDRGRLVARSAPPPVPPALDAAEPTAGSASPVGPGPAAPADTPAESSADTPAESSGPDPSAAGREGRDRALPAASVRDERMRSGLVEFDRWLADRVRGGLAATELSDPSTWEQAAARLVDAQCGGLANRVRRVVARIGRHSGWHDDVLAELALLHVLARGAQRHAALPDDLADAVRAAAGLTVRRAEVVAGVPTTARWLVAGESRAREDRITVQRTWLVALETSGVPGSWPPRPTWAMLLAFGALGREIVSPAHVGHELEADVHWYPGALALRGLLGRIHVQPQLSCAAPTAGRVDDAVSEVGWCVAGEPWIERVPVCLRATPAPVGHGRWSLVDDTGSLPIVPGFARLPELVSVSGGAPVTLMGEWTPDGVVPLTVWVEVRPGAFRTVAL